MQRAFGSWLAKIGDPGTQARLRIISGFILFFYVLTHFINHALGLWSLAVMEQAGEYFRLFWRFLPSSIVLYGAIIGHVHLVLLHLFKRRTLRMSNRE